MKSFIIILMAGLVFVSCGEKKGGKKRRINFPVLEVKEGEGLSNGLRIASLKSKKIEFISEGVGILEKAKINKTSKRFLRQKILRHSYLNFSGERAKELLEIEVRDEYRFFPGEISASTKLQAQSFLSRSGEEGSWKLSGSIELSDLKKNEEVRDLTIGLRTTSLIDGNLSHLGTDILRGKNGQPLTFSKAEQEKEFDLSFSNIPIPLLRTLASFNSELVLEIDDFQIKEESMSSYLERVRAGKTRLIISTPSREYLFFLSPDESLKKFLVKLDPKIKLDYRGYPSNLLSMQQDDMFSRPDRNVLNQLNLYGEKKVWWTNIKGSLENYKVGDQTIVLSFSSYKELRKSREQWEFFQFPLKSDLSIESLKANKVVGEITKESTEFKTIDTEKEIPFEIGTRECIEDHRFERKRADCYIKWRPAFSYPVAMFRTQKDLPKKIRILSKEEFTLEIDGKKKLLENGNFFEVSDLGRNSRLVHSKVEVLKNVKGGFIGWKSYDPQLNNYRTRAPYDNLSSATIKSGFKNTYSVKGWKKVFAPVN